jgi:2,3-dihydroxybenzoate-AMP ligase
MSRRHDELERHLVRWPDYFVQRYRQESAWRDETVAQLLRDTARAKPAGRAIVAPEAAATYRELDELSDRAAAGLIELGLAPGDRALFQLGNAPESAVAFYGAVKAGVIPVCAIPQHGERDMVALARQSGARAYLIQADFHSQDLQQLAAAVREQVPEVEHVVVTRGKAAKGDTLDELIARHDVRGARELLASSVEFGPDDVVVFQLSGGTTGTPKIIPRLHCEYVLNSRCWAEACGWTGDTVVMHPIPLIHNAGIAAAMLPAHLHGATFVVVPRPDPAVIAELIERERVQFLPVVPPAILLRLLEYEERDRYDLSSLTHLIVGGQKLPTELADRVECELGLPCLQMFGMAEGMFLRTPDDATEWVRKHTVGGVISPLDEVRILAPGTEDDVAPGETGELCCRGPYTIRGYFDASGHNAKAFTADGYYRTGDLARAHLLDGQTYYSVEGRIKDVINRGAEKINAEEVEDVLHSHPSVAAVSVVAVPDRELGERACACVVLEEDADALTLEELVAHAGAQGLARFKHPERLEIMDALPLANIGKIDKKALRAQVLDRLGAPTGAG